MTSKEVILAVKRGKYSPYVPLDKVFVKTVVSQQVINKKTLVVKVIKQLNAKEFLVADATGFCKIQITSGFINGKQILHENNYVKNQICQSWLLWKENIFVSGYWGVAYGKRISSWWNKTS